MTAMYHVRQCLAENCRFRYPAPADMPEPMACPRCGMPTTIVTPYLGTRVPDVAQGNHGKCIVEAVLDNIRSTFNTGAMFRIADGAGLQHIHLCGITATPEHPKIAKTALSAEYALPWTYHRNGLDAVQQLKTRGFRIWAVEGGPRAESLYAPFPLATTPLAIVVGNELAGVDPQILELCERVIAIPMQGFKSSLNVAVAFGIAVYHLRFS